MWCIKTLSYKPVLQFSPKCLNVVEAKKASVNQIHCTWTHWLNTVQGHFGYRTKDLSIHLSIHLSIYLSIHCKKNLAILGLRTNNSLVKGARILNRSFIYRKFAFSRQSKSCLHSNCLCYTVISAFSVFSIHL